MISEGRYKSVLCRLCEERSDAAISIFKTVMNCEIAEFVPSDKTEIASPSACNDKRGPARNDMFSDFLRTHQLMTLLTSFE